MSYAERAAPTSERSSILSHAVAETARHLDLGPDPLASILGADRATASDLIDGAYLIEEGTPIWRQAALFVRLYRGVSSIVGNQDHLAIKWLTTPNRAFGDQVPLAAIRHPEGLAFACDYVDAHRAKI